MEIKRAAMSRAGREYGHLKRRQSKTEKRIVMTSKNNRNDDVRRTASACIGPPLGLYTAVFRSTC